MVYQALIHTPHFASGFSPYPSYHTDAMSLDSEEELHQVEALCQDSHNMAGRFKATIMPIRTDSWGALARDLFFPTLLNFSLQSTFTSFSESFEKTHAVSTAFFLLCAFLFDLISLPIRLVTLIPRVVYNQYVTPSEHPLAPFLREKKVHIQQSVPQEMVVSLMQVKEEGSWEIATGKNYHLMVWDREVPFPQSCSNPIREIDDPRDFGGKSCFLRDPSLRKQVS